LETGRVLELDESNFDEEVNGSEIPVLLEFWSPKCSHCMKMHKVLNLLAVEFAGLLKVAKVNVQEHLPLARAYSVSRIPAFFYIVDGSVRASTTGAMTKGKLKEELDLLSIET